MIIQPESEKIETPGNWPSIRDLRLDLLILAVPISILCIVIILESKKMEKAGPKINLAEYGIVVFSSIVVIPWPQFSEMRKATN